METRGETFASRQIAQLLTQADKFVKEGNLTAAMEKIQMARLNDPVHLYAKAYEERLKSLVQHRSYAEDGHAKEERPQDAKPIPQTAKPAAVENCTIPAGEIPEKEKNVQLKPADAAGQSLNQKQIAAGLMQAQQFFHQKEFTKALDEIARIYLLEPHHKQAYLIEEKIRKAIEIQCEEKNDAAVQATAEVQKSDCKKEENHRVAISQKVDMMISRATALYEKRQFNRALDEITRAYILDPHNEVVKKLEETIRKAECELNNAKQSVNRSMSQQIIGNDINEKIILREEKEILHARSTTIEHCFHRVSELLSTNKLEEALNEVASVVVCDPFNEDALNLVQKITAAQHKQLEERRQRCKEIAATIGAL